MSDKPTWRRFIIPAIPIIFSVALDVSPYQSGPLAIALLGLGLIMSVVAAWPWIRRVRLRSPLTLASNPAPAPGATPLIATSPATGPPPDIEWSFEVYGPEHGPQFLSLSPSGYEFRVASLDVIGRNMTDGPLAQLGGLVRSDITSAEYPLLILGDGNYIPIEEVAAVPRHAAFKVLTPQFPSGDQSLTGMAGLKFMYEFAPFTFVFDYNGKRFVRHFSREEVKVVLDAAEGDRMANADVPTPKIMRKPPGGSA